MLDTAFESSQVDERQKATVNLRHELQVLQLQREQWRPTVMDSAKRALVTYMIKDLNSNLTSVMYNYPDRTVH